MCAWRVTNDAKGESSCFPAGRNPVCHQMNVKWKVPASWSFWVGWNLFWGGLRGVRLKRVCDCLSEHFHPRPWFLSLFLPPSLPLLPVRTNGTSIFWRRETSHWRRFWRTLMSTQTSKGWALGVCLRVSDGPRRLHITKGSVSEDRVRSGYVWITRLEMGSPQKKSSVWITFPYFPNVMW